MTRAPVWLAAALLASGCTGLIGDTPTAPPRPAAADGSYCTAARGLDAALGNSINQFASRDTLAADATGLAVRFDSVAARWKSAGNARWRLAGTTAADLRAWGAAVRSGDDERANTTVLALWRDEHALPSCSA
jgi:hypothetical protein